MILRFLICLLLTANVLAKEELSLERIVVIGASVSRGFTEAEPFGGEKSNQLRFDRYLDAALSANHGKIVNDANHLFFVSTEKEAKTQLDRLEHRKPTLVVGIDFLFWFLYGYPQKTGDRLELFDRGLELLSGIEAPLVIGDIPDCSAAIGHMLAHSMVPDAKTRAEANRRLTEWADKKPNVSVVPLSKFVASSEADNAITAGPVTFPEMTTRRLLQADRLHPTHTGCAALALAVMATLTDDGLERDQVVWDLKKIVAATATD
jgi:hypothetical protein